MAQTKTKAKKRPAPKRAKSSSKPKASKAKAKAKSAAGKARSSSNGASGKARSNGSSSKSSNVDAVRHAVGEVGDKAKSATKSVGKAASRAKVPLLAGGAALAGAAGGMALAASKQGRRSGLAKAVRRRPKVKVSSKDVAKAAKEVGNFSAQVGELADELQRARKSADGKHRSPVEVVLQGLTARR